MSLRFTWRLFFAAGALVIHSLVGGPLVEAQTTEGSVSLSFESGDFTGFDTIGIATIEDASFGVQPTDGNTQALLSTGDGFVVPMENVVEIETALNLDPGTLSGLGGTNGSALALEFFGIEGETISFDYSFLTNEFTPNVGFNDFAVVSLSSEGSSFFEVLGDTFSDNFVLSPPDRGQNLSSVKSIT